MMLWVRYLSRPAPGGLLGGATPTRPVVYRGTDSQHSAQALNTSTCSGQSCNRSVESGENQNVFNLTSI
jgi:hypothetical protein